MPAQNQIVGILGGKGPEATGQLFQWILKHTPASREEDHLRIIVDNNPQIPKPSLGITGEGADPRPALIETAKNLEKAKADFLVIPCNSAHYYVEDIRAAISIPVFSIIAETVAAVQKSKGSQVGLLATSGLVRSGIYQQMFVEAQIGVLLPQENDQGEMMDRILEFKDTGHRSKLSEILDRICADLISRGAGGIVLGCTELPVILEGRSYSVPFYDTLEILALAAVREATRYNPPLGSSQGTCGKSSPQQKF